MRSRLCNACRKWSPVSDWDGGCPVCGHDNSQRAGVSYQVMPDIKPYKSMIDGRIITSRSRHREHLRDHDCIEVGNDSSLRRKPKPIESPPGLKEKIIRAVNDVEERKRRSKCH